MGYLAHWFVVIPWVALRMALIAKRLVWEPRPPCFGVFHDDPTTTTPCRRFTDLTTSV